RIQAARGIVFEADCLISQCLDRDFDLIALPGGLPGAENLAASPELADLLKKQAGRQALYGGICASPALVLHPLGLVREGAVTCHPGFAHFIGETSGERVSRDGCCITSRGGGTSLDFALALVELLFPQDTLDEVRAGLALG
ncbi:MAG: DJ-1/PfpI family protein, partial [Desulfobacterales bacterium]|nr:DJ-1/PfpI family protein [Desulfobacterales bacterium]